MKVTELELPGVKLIEPTYFEDNRGHSAEAYNDRTLKEYGISTQFVVDYICRNVQSGTVRGIHFQNNPHPQTKLVRVLKGEILDFVIDLRKDSPTYKKWVSQVLSEENRKQLYLPNGYGHAYVTTKADTVVLYKFDDYYDRNLVRAIRWNDPEIGLPWGVEAPVLSASDEKAPWLKESDVNLTMAANTARKNITVVTGATGFIGKALVRELSKNPETLIYAVGRNQKELDALNLLGNVVPVQADFRAYDSLENLIHDEADVFYHCAFRGGFAGDALKDYSLQLENTQSVCDAVSSAMKMHTKKFVLASTVNVMEVKQYFTEQDYSPRYTGIYSAGKVAAEVIGKTLAAKGGMEFCTAFIAMPYGEENTAETLPNVLIQQFNAGIRPKLIEGNNLYDLIYIDDVAKGLCAIGERGKNFKDYYLGHRKLKTFKAWISEMRDSLAPDMQLTFGEFPDAPSLDYSLVDLDALYRDTGFECKADFKESILKTGDSKKSQRGGGDGNSSLPHGQEQNYEKLLRRFTSPPCSSQTEGGCMSVKHIVITGASGFIGKALTEYFLKLGYHVTAVLRNKQSLEHLQHNENLTCVTSDFSGYKDLSSQITHADIFYHIAWEGISGTAAGNYKMQLQNVQATCEALVQAHKMGCKKFVFAGTVAELEVIEHIDRNICQPRNANIYASAKLCAEMMCKTLAVNYGIQFNSGLFANIIGPGDYSSRSTNSILNKFIHGTAPKLVKGEGLNDWLYIKDAVKLIAAMGEHGINMKTYYIGHTNLWSLRTIVEKARDIVAPDLKLNFGEVPDEFLTNYDFTSTTTLFEDTGVKADYPFSEAIRETAEWVKSRNMEL